jgi:SpoIIAA-like
MIERIPDLPGNVLGFSAKGAVTGKDYESTIIPAVEEMIGRLSKVRLLYHLGPEFSGFDAAALWDDAKVGLGHVRAWERVAVVTDVDWIRMATKAFAFAMPGEVRVFRNAEMATAREWLAA